MIFKLQSEVDLYKAVIHWIEADSEMRMHYYEKLLNEINWMYMDDHEIAEVLRFRPDLFDDGSVLQKFVLNGLWLRALIFNNRLEGIEHQLRPYRCFTIEELEKMIDDNKVDGSSGRFYFPKSSTSKIRFMDDYANSDESQE